ncbi:MAG: hypothetical protein Q8L64_06100 [bacterium]|nr:hypothetical protein [bacterium]
MKNGIIITVISALILVGGAWWVTAPSKDPNVITKKGIHWHPELEIYVKGEKIEIPQGIGLSGTVHNPLHTHEDLPIIHLEYGGKVTKDDTKVTNFFRVWGKSFGEFGNNVTMSVNGVENMELENYQMKDKDKVVLRYE